MFYYILCKYFQVYTISFVLNLCIFNKQVPSQIWDRKEGEDRKGEKRLILLSFKLKQPA